MPLWLRCHAPFAIAFEGASVLAVKRDGGASWGEAMMTARGTRECYALLKRLGYKVYPSGACEEQACCYVARGALACFLRPDHLALWRDTLFCPCIQERPGLQASRLGSSLPSYGC